MSAPRLTRRLLRLPRLTPTRAVPRTLNPLLHRLSSSSSAAASTAAPQRLGQPHPSTHPHLLASTDLTPHLTPLHYALRRAQFASLLPPNTLAILPSHELLYRSGPVFYDFHQHPDFYYLTGFLEPSSVCIIEKNDNHEGGDHIFHLFCRDKNAHAELWDGARTGIKNAEDVFGADRAHDVEALSRVLPRLVEGKDVVYTDVDFVSGKGGWVVEKAGQKMKDAFEGVRRMPTKNMMHQLRIIKSGEEAKIMRETGKKSGRAYNRAFMREWKSEHELAAYLEYWFKRNGCEKSAYVPVVAGGTNALSIHYTSNDSQISPGDLILVDAAGQYGGYCADITRTFPATGRFSESQKRLYQAVLNVQKHCVALCRADLGKSLDEIHREAEKMLATELEALGFKLDYGAINNVLFPHHVGHYLGVDLHDCGTYGRTRKLQRGMVVTIEPGVYVPVGDERFPEEYWGMGIRIEDAVYVAEENPIVLTVEAVKEVVDIEALRDHDESDDGDVE